MSDTLHLHASSPADIARAAELLRTGFTVAFATETVYGLGASALSASAVAKIFTAKQRPAWDPLIVHLADASQLPTILHAELYPDLRHRIEVLAQAFWPGPLTLLLPRNASVPDAVTAGRVLVGVRVPSHPAAQALLRAAGIPIAAPSANQFGHTSPTTAAHVLADLNGRIDAVLDAGPTSVGLESTVLDPTQTPMVLYRPGSITAEQITAATGLPVRVFRSEVRPADFSQQPPASLPSPGVMLRHYAPRVPLVLVEDTPFALDDSLHDLMHGPLANPAERPGVLLPTDWKIDAYSSRILLEPWAPWQDSDALAATLFAGLRSLGHGQPHASVHPEEQPRAAAWSASRALLERGSEAVGRGDQRGKCGCLGRLATRLHRPSGGPGCSLVRGGRRRRPLRAPRLCARACPAVMPPIRRAVSSRAGSIIIHRHAHILLLLLLLPPPRQQPPSF